MSEVARSSFDVTGWEPAPYGDEGDDDGFSRATVTKRFQGDLIGESSAQLLMYRADPEDLGVGAGYVASERFGGTLGGRAGGFVLHHWGTSFGTTQRTGGHVVPGSATGELEGLTGSVRIDVDADGGHTITLEYEL